MNVFKETGKDRSGIDWLRSKHKLHKTTSKYKRIRASIPKTSGWKCIAILENGKSCKNHRVDDEFYCVEHLPSKENS